MTVRRGKGAPSIPVGKTLKPGKGGNSLAIDPRQPGKTGDEVRRVRHGGKRGREKVRYIERRFHGCSVRGDGFSSQGQSRV